MPFAKFIAICLKNETDSWRALGLPPKNRGPLQKRLTALGRGCYTGKQISSETPAKGRHRIRKRISAGMRAISVFFIGWGSGWSAGERPGRVRSCRPTNPIYDKKERIG